MKEEKWVLREHPTRFALSKCTKCMTRICIELSSGVKFEARSCCFQTNRNLYCSADDYFVKIIGGSKLFKVSNPDRRKMLRALQKSN